MRLVWAILIIWMLYGCLSSPALAKKKVKPHRSQPTYVHGTQDLIAEINHAIYGVPSKTTVGIIVKSMRTGETLYTKNDQHLFVPASILKVMTAEAALVYLGPEYRFQTNLLTDAKSIDHGVIHGNVYLVHSGDPTLTYTDFVDLMTALKEQKLERINGNVYIDNFAYDQDNFGPGWDWNDTRFCFAAPINASIINRNCISLKIMPAKVPGNLAEVVTFSRFFYPGIDNQVLTKAHGSRSCSVHLAAERNFISLSGCIPKGHYEQGATTVISDVVQYNQSLLRSLFKQYNIEVTGSIKSGIAPNNLSVLAKHQSEPLRVLVTEMLKKSENVIAGSIFKKLGSLYLHKPGSWKNGGTAVTQILGQKAGVNTQHISVIDGSGLSRYNQVSPAQMMQTLDFAYHNKATNYEFISALPIAGKDGTLKKRLFNVSGKVHAKTGTMSGVVALAGYVTSADKEPIAFVMIFNGRNGMGWAYRSIEDKIVTVLAKYSR